MNRPLESEQIEVNGVVFSFGDIQRVVATFYNQVARDEVLKVPFSSVQDWPHHIERLTHFWWIRLNGNRYLDVTYNPVEKHFEAGFNDAFLKRWLELFNTTLDAELNPEQAKFWMTLASRMGQALGVKNELYRQMMTSSSS